MGKRGMKPYQATQLKVEKGIKLTKLQKIRVKRNLSQSELSALSGLSVRRIQHYEQVEKSVENARLDTLLNLCVALNCKLEDIIESKSLIDKLRMINKP